MKGKSDFSKENKVVFDYNILDADCKHYAASQGTTYTYLTIVNNLSNSVLSKARTKASKTPEIVNKYKDKVVGILAECEMNKIADIFKLDKQKYILEIIPYQELQKPSTSTKSDNAMNIQYISEFVCEMATAQRQMLDIIKIQDERIKNQNAMILSMKNCMEDLGKIAVQSMEYLKSIDGNLK